MRIEDLYKHFLSSTGVSTDTRMITPGSVFFALKGPRFNANEFAEEALKKGAAYAVVDEQAFVTNDKCILVDDGLTALQDLARYHRSQLKIPFVALTGSNGKTTSKELVNAVLSTKFRTHATKGNLNNHIGVPLTVLSIGPAVEMAVIEMGANHVGEIADLCSIANPTHGFITNIGKAHIGTFGGFENIVKGKSELYDHLERTGGTTFVNSQNKLLADLAKRFKSAVWYPSPGDFYKCSLISSDPFLLVEAENGDQVQTQLTGAYNFENVAAALCIGKFFGVDPAKANAALSAYTPSNMRSQVMKKGSNTVILDAYNANPSSMAAAIENIASMNASNKVLMIGDMFELEGEAEKEHREIGRLIKLKGFKNVYLCGSLFKAALNEIPFAKHFEKKEQLVEELKKNPIKDATILVKASRGIGLEAVVEYL
ncbi:MAG TPA: UDP-N-acetylmuramoyl-tripeptide--D-alanyl-D-alanine ligase [Cyclobacteriaceae bacterium]|nr:UDP-N-acetylmuramoyl-tripeptide--D-alanyl-D-alanine ligase [Cyclobacteriaceae bacterium]